MWFLTSPYPFTHLAPGEAKSSTQMGIREEHTGHAQAGSCLFPRGSELPMESAVSSTPPCWGSLTEQVFHGGGPPVGEWVVLTWGFCALTRGHSLQQYQDYR